MSTCLPTSCFFASARADLAASLHRFAALCKVPLLVAILHLRSCDGWKPPVLFQVHPVHHACLTLAICFWEGSPTGCFRITKYQCCTVLNCARQGMRLYSAPSTSTFSMTQSSGRTFSAILMLPRSVYQTEAKVAFTLLQSASFDARPEQASTRVERSLSLQGLRSFPAPGCSCTTLSIGTVTLTSPLFLASGASDIMLEPQWLCVASA